MNILLKSSIFSIYLLFMKSYDIVYYVDKIQE